MTGHPRPARSELDAEPEPEEPAEGEVVEGEAATEEVVEGEVVDADPVGEEADLISAQLTAAQAELDEYRDTLQRLKAEFDNYKKRVLREQTALVERASAELIRELLPVLDAFEAALSSPAGEGDAEKLRQGLDLVWSQLTSVLGGVGLERIGEVEVPFDPERHEAVMSSGEGQEGPVVEDVMRSGWALRGHVLRPAMVRVRG